jgi:toxin HigB-1
MDKELKSRLRMIFKCKETEKIAEGQGSRKLPQQIQKKAFRQLMRLKYAASPEDLRIPPGNRLEKLSGDREGQWSIRINDQWRVCFKWNDEADEVEIVDYH